METMYIIDKSNFNGSVLSTFYPATNKVSYTDFTFEEYNKQHNGNLICLSWEDFNKQYFAPYLQGLQSEFKEISEDDYSDMLNCLPPCKWHNLNERFNSFYCSEAYTADLNNFYIVDRKTGKYYTALRSRFIKDVELIEQLKTQLN